MMDLLRNSQRQLCGFKSLVVLCLFMVYSLLFFHVKSLKLFRASCQQKHMRRGREKVILAWNSYTYSDFNQEDWLLNCPNAPCRLTSDRALYKEASAIIFFLYYPAPPYFVWSDIPPERHESQRYIAYAQECADSIRKANYSLNFIPNFFNWTASFRKDSDCYTPWGYTTYDPVPSLKHINTTFVKVKKKLVAWAVSNCEAHNRREVYVAYLSKYINIDIFGRCAFNQEIFISDDMFHEFLLKIEETYKFYLALENSVCRDYISEKFFIYGQYMIVPIVTKRSIYSDIAPPNSFIAIDDFKSPAELARYLLYLDKNEEEYLKFFRWRLQGYKLVTTTIRHYPCPAADFCFLCYNLWNPLLPHKTINDLESWVLDQAGCEKDYLFHFLPEYDPSQQADIALFQERKRQLENITDLSFENLIIKQNTKPNPLRTVVL